MKPASTLTIAQQAALHAALSDPARLHLLALCNGTRTVQELEAALSLRYHRFSQPTVAYHLRLLCKAGLIEGERRKTAPYSRSTYYHVRRETLKSLAETLWEEAMR